MPTGDNPYKIDQQFTEAITPPNYQSTAQTPPQSGTPGQNRTGAIASIADKFLAGVSAGRAKQFQQQQQERAGLMQDVNRQYDSLEKQKNDLTPEAYQQARSKLDALHVLAVKTAVDQSDNKSSPIVKGLKSMFEGILGPGGKKFELGPEQIYKTLYGVNQIAQDPKNSRTAAVTSATEQMDAAANRFIADKRKADPKYVPTLADLNEIPGFTKSYQQATQLNGGKPPDIPIVDAAKAETAKQAKVAENQATAAAKPLPKDERDQDRWNRAYISRYNRKHPDAQLDPSKPLDAENELIAQSQGKGQAKAATRTAKWAIPKGQTEAVPVFVDTAGNEPGIYDTNNQKIEIEKFAAPPTAERLYGQMQGLVSYWEGLGYTREEAKAKAGEDVRGQLGVHLSAAQQSIAKKAIDSGVGAGPGLQEGKPKETDTPPVGQTATPPGTPKPKAAAPPGTPKPTATPPKSSTFSDREKSNIEQYIQKGGNDTLGKQGLSILTSGKIKDADGNPVLPATVKAREERQKAAQKAYDKLTALVDSTRSFDNALQRHATILENNRSALPSTDIPRINKLLLSGAEEFNMDGLSPAAAKYALSLQAVRNEYARIIGGGVQSTGQTAEGARIDAGKALADGFSKGSMSAALGQMKQEVTQKTSGIQDELKREQGIISQPIIPEIYGQKYKEEEAGEPAPVLSNTSQKKTATPPGRTQRTAPPQAGLPKPAKAGEVATDAVIDQYIKAGKTHADMIKDGWK